MGYKIVITLEAKEDLERFVKYLVKDIFTNFRIMRIKCTNLYNLLTVV